MSGTPSRCSGLMTSIDVRGCPAGIPVIQNLANFVPARVICVTRGPLHSDSTHNPRENEASPELCHLPVMAHAHVGICQCSLPIRHPTFLPSAAMLMAIPRPAKRPLTSDRVARSSRQPISRAATSPLAAKRSYPLLDNIRLRLYYKVEIMVHDVEY